MAWRWRVASCRLEPKGAFHNHVLYIFFSLWCTCYTTCVHGLWPMLLLHFLIYLLLPIKKGKKEKGKMMNFCIKISYFVKLNLSKLFSVRYFYMYDIGKNLY